MQTSFADIDESFPRLPAYMAGVPTGDGPLFVRRLIYGAGHRDLCIEGPTWQQIIAAVSDLDGLHDVRLEGQDFYPYLVVCGGKESKYMVAYSTNNAAYYLFDPHCRSQETFSISIGGQAAKYEADLCMNRETAMQAIWEFAQQGTRSSSVRWIDHKDDICE